jgi:hypothetical protein
MMPQVYCPGLERPFNRMKTLQTMKLAAFFCLAGKENFLLLWPGRKIFLEFVIFFLTDGFYFFTL